ncbi:MAG: hypothetical protein LBB20_00525 [Puniceicoccales bacterium]|jgi:hypothetical protein|nr:hypothetical protein [Puniceicoccales bacterium]
MANGFEDSMDEKNSSSTRVSEARNLLVIADKMFNEYGLGNDTIDKLFELEFVKPYKSDVIEAIKDERNRFEMMGLVPEGGWEKLPLEVDEQNDEKSQEMLKRRAKTPGKDKPEIAVNKEDKRSSLQQMAVVKNKLEEFIENVKASEAELKDAMAEPQKLALQKKSEPVSDSSLPLAYDGKADKAKIAESVRSDEYKEVSISEYSEKIEQTDDYQKISTSQAIKKVADELEKAGVMVPECRCDALKKDPEDVEVDNITESAPKSPAQGNKAYRSSRTRGTVISALRSSINRYRSIEPGLVKEKNEGLQQVREPSNLSDVPTQPIAIEGSTDSKNADVSKKVKIRRRLKL